MDECQKIAAELKNYSDTPELDAHFFWLTSKGKTSTAADFIRRRRAGEPVSKILGEKGFFKYIFKTSVDVLDPRPDSETLIESVLKHYPDKKKPLSILDIGTGSGCLLICLMNEYENAQGTAIDKSKKALIMAQENAAVIAYNKAIKFHEADFMKPNWTNQMNTYDIIISNPPYIKTSDIERLEKSVKNYDPLMALDGGADGLMAYKALAQTIKPLLNPNGKIFFEIGQGQSRDVEQIMFQKGFKMIDADPDLGGIIRVLVFQALS